ncbi:MAG: Zn-ribbon domain-containing OB-fold protein [Patescibacteria group bacterium]
MEREPSSVVSPEKIQLGGRGKIYSYAINYEGVPERFQEFVPYVSALIDLEEGIRVTAMLTDLEERWVPETDEDGEERLVLKYNVYIGMEVEMVTRRLFSEGERGLIQYGYKFRPPLRQQPEPPSD